MHLAIRATRLRTKTDQMVSKGGAPRVQGRVNNVKAPIVLDGGSVLNIISLDFALVLGIKEIFKSSYSFCVADGRTVSCFGITYDLQVTIHGVNRIIKTQVFNQKLYLLLMG